MTRKIEEKLTKKEIEKLLKEKTRVILDAVNEKVLGLEKKIAKLKIKMERRFDQLITTLDKFLKRLTDLEDEFTIMKAKIRKIEEVF
jgi:hypothetical protein